MRFGSDSKFLKVMEQRQARGERVEALEDIPELYPDVQFIWSAFGELSSSRTYGFGHANPIQIGEIKSWLDLNAITDLEDRREIVLLVQAMDRMYLFYAQEQTKLKNKRIERKAKKK